MQMQRDNIAWRNERIESIDSLQFDLHAHASALGIPTSACRTARAMGPNLACADLTRQWLIVVTVDTCVFSISSCLHVHVDLHVRYTM